MSWSWKEENELVKQYEQAGTVTISTEEYKDLIAQLFKLQFAGQREHDDWYSEMNKRIALEKEVESLKKQVDSVNAWLKEDELATSNYKAWKLRKLEEESA